MHPTLDEPILIIYDSPGIRETIQLLDPAVCRCIWETEQAQEALSLIQRNAPSLILLCAMTKNTWSFNFCREIKNTDTLCHLPVLILCLNSREEIRTRAVMAGADETLQINCSPDDLLFSIRSLLYARKLSLSMWNGERTRLEAELAEAKSELKNLRQEVVSHANEPCKRCDELTANKANQEILKAWPDSSLEPTPAVALHSPYTPDDTRSIPKGDGEAIASPFPGSVH